MCNNNNKVNNSIKISTENGTIQINTMAGSFEKWAALVRLKCKAYKEHYIRMYNLVHLDRRPVEPKCHICGRLFCNLQPDFDIVINFKKIHFPYTLNWVPYMTSSRMKAQEIG